MKADETHTQSQDSVLSSLSDDYEEAKKMLTNHYIRILETRGLSSHLDIISFLVDQELRPLFPGSSVPVDPLLLEDLYSFENVLLNLIVFCGEDSVRSEKYAKVLLEYFKNQLKDQDEKFEIIQTKAQVAQEVKSRIDSSMLETWKKNLEFKLGKSHPLTLEYYYYFLLRNFETSFSRGPDHNLYTPLDHYFLENFEAGRPIPAERFLTGMFIAQHMAVEYSRQSDGIRLSALDLIRKAGRLSNFTAQQALEVAKAFSTQAQALQVHDESILFYEHLLASVTSKFGEYSPERRTILTYMTALYADPYKSQSMLDGTPYFEELIRVNRLLLNKQERDYSAALEAYGYYCMLVKNYEKSCGLYLEAAEVLEEAYGKANHMPEGALLNASQSAAKIPDYKKAYDILVRIMTNNPNCSETIRSNATYYASLIQKPAPNSTTSPPSSTTISPKQEAPNNQPYDKFPPQEDSKCIVS
jgi:hypothetical protein